jgi:hypothetical protein
VADVEAHRRKIRGWGNPETMGNLRAGISLSSGYFIQRLALRFEMRDAVGVGSCSRVREE